MRHFALIALAIFALCPGSANAEIVEFTGNAPSWNNGLVTIWGDMDWNPTGGDHVFANNWNTDDFIFFATPQKVNDWEMTKDPFFDFSFGDSHMITVELRDSASGLLWSEVIDLGNNGWDNPLTVSANVENVSTMVFRSPFNDHGSNFFPSVDNIRLNDFVAAVPEPGSMSVLGLLALGTIATRRRKK